MKLLIIVLALLALRYIHIGRSEARYAWLFNITSKWLNWLQAKGVKNISFLMILLILPILILLYSLKIALHTASFGLFWFLLNLILFWFTLWPVSPEQLAEEGFAPNSLAHNKDKILIDEQGEILTNPKSNELSRNYSKKLLIEANQNTFAVIFWFIFLGIYGAIIYRLINLLYRRSAPISSIDEFKILLNLLQHYMDWIPARFVSLGYVLAGDFMPSFHIWRHYASKNIAANNDLLTKTGLRAAGYDPENNTQADREENRTLIHLVDRTLIVWLFLIAIMVIGHWMY